MSEEVRKYRKYCVSQEAHKLIKGQARFWGKTTGETIEEIIRMWLFVTQRALSQMEDLKKTEWGREMLQKFELRELLGFLDEEKEG